MRLLRVTLAVVWAGMVGGVHGAPSPSDATPVEPTLARDAREEAERGSITSAYVRAPASTVLPMTHELLQALTSHESESNLPEQVTPAPPLGFPWLEAHASEVRDGAMPCTKGRSFAAGGRVRPTSGSGGRREIRHMGSARGQRGIGD